MAGFYDNPPSGGYQTEDSLDGFYGESSVGESINDSIARAEAAADSAEASEVAAGISETNAATSEANAASSEANAAASESAAQSSAAAALVSEDLSHKWAQNPEDVQVSGGEYSSYHWAQKALAAVISGGAIGPGAGTTTPGFIPLWGDTDGTSLLSGIDPATKADVSYVDSQDALKAPLASPTFTGTPAAPTAAVDDTTTKLATTAFVVGQAASAVSPVNGTAAVGTSKRYARQDHVHGTDTTRAPLASPTFTGTPAAPTAALGINTTQIATTAFVQNQTTQLSKSVAGGANVTLTATEAGNYHIVLTGAITANISVIVPIAIKKEYIFLDNTTGAYTITVKTPSGTGVVTPKATRMVVYCDGVNVVPVVRPQESVTDTTAGSLLVQGAYGMPTSSNYSVTAKTTSADSTTDWDTITTPGYWGSLLGGSNPNHPVSGKYFYCLVASYNNNKTQIAIPYGTDNGASSRRLFIRTLYNSTWSAWSEIWTSESLVKTTSPTDTTAGSMLKVGDFGLGAAYVTTQTTLGNIISSGFYITPNSGITDLPAGATMERYNLLVAGGAGYVYQFLMKTNTSGSGQGDLWTRASNNSGSTWSAWGSVFTSADTRLSYGVSASAWSSGYSSIDMGWGGLASQNFTPAILLATNSYFDGTNYKYKNTGVAHNIVTGAYNIPLIIQTAASGSAGANVTFSNLLSVDPNGVVACVSPTGGVGYGTGAGGTVTQVTSKATTVTLNKPCGQITMHAASLAANTTVSFTLNNSLLAATDMVIVSPNWGANPGAYQAWCTSNGAGGCIISVRNMTAGALSDALLLNFQIHKGAAA